MAAPATLPDIHASTARYEQWLGRHLRLVRGDLQLKHERMREGLFLFMRATYYRWAEQWLRLGDRLHLAPEVLAVGDLHLENFGTWRDAEGRLIWGVNDFDEAARLPYTSDLVRLAANALLAIRERHLRLSESDAMAALLEGYDASLAGGGRPFVLADEHRALRVIAVDRLKDPKRFWNGLEGLRRRRAPLPAGVGTVISRMLPAPGLKRVYYDRVAGLGSLGRERVVAIAEWEGGKVAREAKALAPSAALWAAGKRGGTILYQAVLDRAVRCADPFVMARSGWIVRRLAPDCSRIELADLPHERDETRLLYDMGWETANIHLAGGRAGVLRRHLAGRPRGWLERAADDMADMVVHDWKAWRDG
jgi:hypothetical protein